MDTTPEIITDSARIVGKGAFGKLGDPSAAFLLMDGHGSRHLVSDDSLILTNCETKPGSGKKNLNNYNLTGPSMNAAVTGLVDMDGNADNTCFIRSMPIFVKISNGWSSVFVGMT